MDEASQCVYVAYTTEVGQTVLNRIMLALLCKPCWPGLAQLASAQFYDCLHCQTNWADPCWPTKMCQCKCSIICIKRLSVLSTPGYIIATLVADSFGVISGRNIKMSPGSSGQILHTCTHML